MRQKLRERSYQPGPHGKGGLDGAPPYPFCRAPFPRRRGPTSLFGEAGLGAVIPFTQLIPS